MRHEKKSASTVQLDEGDATDGRTDKYDDGDYDVLCGVGSFRPQCIQWLTDRKLFLLFFSIMEIGQSVFYSYFRSVITTLEKQFSVSTQMIAFVMAGKEVSQILCGVVLAYYGGRGNRPRWIAAGMFIVTISCLMTASPIVFWQSSSLPSEASSVHTLNMCTPEVAAGNRTSSSTPPDCHRFESSVEEDSSATVALLLIFFGKFVGGVGISMMVTLTLPYLDDNSTKSASALYIAILTGLRVMGPAIGSFLAGMCLSINVDLSEDPGIDQDDPRWIGAWWLGYLMIGLLFILGSAIVIWFPASMRRNGKSSTAIDRRRPSTTKSIEDISNNNTKESTVDVAEQGLPSALKRLMTNKILMFNTASRVFTLFGNNGFDTFQPKYLESHFQQTASSASFFSGLSSNAMRILGIVAVGIVFRFWKPRAIYVNAWNIFLDFWFIGSLLVLMSLSCPNVSFIGGHGHQIAEPSSQLASCSSHCSCSAVQFSPVCLNGTNYFSPCHAGCSAASRMSFDGSTKKKKNRMVFYNCSCSTDFVESLASSGVVTPMSSLNNGEDGSTLPEMSVASAGFCDYLCSAFTMYLVVVAIQKTFNATRKIGRTLIILRCIDEQDKSLALAITAVMESAFAYIPCPIVYGAFLDAGCILWEGSSFGGGANHGHCWLYDADHMRYVVHGLTIFFMAGATVFDCIMLYLCRDLSFFDDDDDDNDDDDTKKQDGSSRQVSTSLESVLDTSADRHHGSKTPEPPPPPAADWSHL